MAEQAKQPSQPQRIESADLGSEFADQQNHNSLDDWTILYINKNANNDNEMEVSGSEHNLENDELVEEAEVAECAEEQERIIGVSDDIETKSAASSDISVIEGDYENSIVERRESQSLEGTDLLQYFDKITQLSQNGFTKNVIIVCLVAIILAMYADRSTKDENACMFMNGMNPPHPIENQMLMDHLKELNTVLSEMKPFISKLDSTQPNPKGVKDVASGYQQFNSKPDANVNYSSPELLLQSSLNNLCTIMSSVQSTNQPVIDNICESRGVIFNLIEFKAVVNSSLREFDKFPVISKYLQDMDQKLSHLCQSLVDDLSVAVDRLIFKVYNKLNKANNKLNKWVCSVKGNNFLYGVFLNTYDKNKILEACNQVVNSTAPEFKKKSNYVEDDNSSNVTYNFWRKDGININKYRENKFDKKKDEKKCNKRKRADGEMENFCEDHHENTSKENVVPLNSNGGKFLDSPWIAIKSTFKTGKSRKPHKSKGKTNKKLKQPSGPPTSCLGMNESQDDDAGKKCDWKEPKYKKYDKKERKGPEEDDFFRINMNSEWQWKRNEAREMFREQQNEPSDWYFERANSRKDARRDAVTKKHSTESDI